MIELNKIYTFKIEHLFHPSCPKGVQTSMGDKIRKDGRTASPIITSYVSEEWFKELTYVDKEFLDFEGEILNEVRNVEKKMFTLNGCKFCPSNMVGKGRKIDPVKSSKICKENRLIYLIADATEFPHVYVTFLDGNELHELHKSCSIGYNDKWRQFYFGRNAVS
jgi:hypothetical protein